MSSDVYFSIYEDRETTNLIENIRVGHLAVLYYFGFDALSEIQEIVPSNWPSMITAELINSLKIVINRAHSSVLIDQNLGEEEFTSRYGYLGPHGIPWDDIINDDEMEEALKEFVGKYIRAGVD